MAKDAQRWLGPGETARRLGVTTKALRVYEREGLVVPRRADSGWRLYGPAQLVRLHQIIVLRNLELSLASIKTLVGSESRLREVLRLQRESLEAQQSRTSRALDLIKAAERRLDAGQELSLDDLATLTKETLVQPPTRLDEFRNRFEARIRELDPTGKTSHLMEDIRQSARSSLDAAHVADVKALIAEAAELRTTCDPGSEAARDIVRRLRSLVPHVKRPPDDQIGVLRSALTETVADAEARSESVPFDIATLDFLRQVQMGMRESGELT